MPTFQVDEIDYGTVSGNAEATWARPLAFFRDSSLQELVSGTILRGDRFDVLQGRDPYAIYTAAQGMDDRVLKGIRAITLHCKIIDEQLRSTYVVMSGYKTNQILKAAHAARSHANEIGESLILRACLQEALDFIAEQGLPWSIRIITGTNR